MPGWGLQPAGTTSAGYGTPPTAPTLTGKVYQDPSSGVVQGGRYIDAALRDYRLNEDNRLAGMNYVQQMVYLAVRTEQTSSALRELGHTLHTIKVITENFEFRVLTVLTQAVQHLITAGLIQVLGFSEYRQGPDGVLLAGGIQGKFRFRDLTTGRDNAIEIS
jgi:hypothetical protein